MFSPEVPYNDLPRITDLFYEPSSEVRRLAEEAHAALAVLNYATNRLPNVDILVETIALKEAKISSEIENIRTTNDELFKSVISDDLSAEAKEVSDYKDALMKGFNILKVKEAFSISDIEEINRPLNHKGSGIRADLAGFESKTRIVKGSGKDAEVLYTPPHGKPLLTSLLIDMLDYIYDDEIYDYSPLIKIALAHYQFECIHPFSDGNGRTGRMLNLLMICQKGFLDNPALCSSLYISEHKDRYYELLQETKETENYESFIIYMLQSIINASKATLDIVEWIENNIKKYSNKNYLAKFNGQMFLLEIAINIVFNQVYTRISDLVTEGIHRQTAAVYLDQFADAGLLSKEKHGRENIYKNIMLINYFN